MIGETKFRADARLVDGKLTLTVSGICPYGDRSVTVTEEVKTAAIKSTLKDALADAIESVETTLDAKAQGEAARAMLVATDKKEAL